MIDPCSVSAWAGSVLVLWALWTRPRGLRYLDPVEQVVARWRWEQDRVGVELAAGAFVVAWVGPLATLLAWVGSPA